ncbi:cupredoxin domain-containing protein [Cohnella yongneupensis]|uniref:Cupredoxin domain-containing protein n=1 Tax=Cohnella yongneupensis TaxID=425006 RepID=A0ABW0QYF9_9BACL
MKLKSVKLGMVLALITLFALSACGKSNNNSSNSQSPSAPASSPAAAGGGATKEVTEHAVNWSFSEPEIKANVGDTLKLTLNNDKGAHGLQIEDLGVALKNGETATIKLDKAGTYDFHCNIQCGQGHDNMVGQIIVQ